MTKRANLVRPAFKSLVIALFTGLAGAQLQAAPISQTDILTNWTQDTGLRSNGGPTSAWFGSGPQAVAPDTGSIVSDFVLSGDFTFSGTMLNGGGDDDIMGFAWMVQDNGNHHRFAWDAFDVNNGYGDSAGTNGVPNGPLPTDPTVHGIRVLKEVGDVPTYFSQELPSATPYTRGLFYDFSVTRVGVNFTVLVTQGPTTILNKSYADATFSSGRVALYADSQSNVGFSNIDVTIHEVPEPAMAAIFALAVAGLGAARRRK